MSLFWSNTGWGQEKWWNAATVDMLVDEWNIEMIRAAMGAEDGGGFIEDPFANRTRVETIIEAAIARNIYVIIDWHSHHAEDNVGASIDFFRDMAQRYGHHDNVIFEIYNEPLNTTSWNTVKSYAEQIVPVIREHSDNLIIVGNPWWSQRVDEAAFNPVSGSNIAYALHFYVGSHGNGVRGFAQTALDAGAAVFASEWGIWPNGADDGMGRDDWMNFLDQNKISSAYWAIADKDEPPSIWLPSGGLSERGEWVQNSLAGYAATAPWRTGSSNAGPQQLPASLMIDNVDDADTFSFWGGEWGSFDDSGDGGQSTITGAAQLPASGAISAQINFSKGALLWDPYAGFALSLNASDTGHDLSGCSAVQYDYRGDSHDFRVEQTNIADFGFHQHTAPSSNDWRTILVNFNQLAQPSWAAGVAQNVSSVRALSWQIGGSDGSSASIEIDNVSCLGATPPAGANFPTQ
ncbi:MAG: hypothetical protein COA42_20415 [Alteromonadaceae bacterium]|nr:MAG: hypothetical protein COA42_20415 [Alteromonadaceae bacterium]